MDPHHTDPSNMKISTPNQGSALRLIGGTQDYPNSTHLLYQLSQTCRIILVPLLLRISDAETSGTFSPPHLIRAEMPQILYSYQSEDMV